MTRKKTPKKVADAATETPATPAATTHCGEVALVGRPNVGKSTLLNALIGQKLSITTPKPQTTRHRIRGIKTTETAQIIYVDTPGIHDAGKRPMNRTMNRAAVAALVDVDVIVFVLEALHWNEDDDRVLEHLKGLDLKGLEKSPPIIVVVNKVDQVKDKPLLLPYMQQLPERLGAAWDIVPLSARKRDNIESLERLLIANLPEGEAIFPEDQVTDRSMRFLAAEIIREKLMRRLAKELPYHLTVEIEKFQEEEGTFEINAVIWVERTSQKGIVIGAHGDVLKEVGTKARFDMEKMFGQHVFLHLWVKVKEGWSEDARLLRSLGLDEE